MKKIATPLSLILARLKKNQAAAPEKIPEKNGTPVAPPAGGLLVFGTANEGLRSGKIEIRNTGPQRDNLPDTFSLYRGVALLTTGRFEVCLEAAEKLGVDLGTASAEEAARSEPVSDYRPAYQEVDRPAAPPPGSPAFVRRLARANGVRGR